MKTIRTIPIDLQVVSLKKFLQNIGRSKIDRELFEYTTQISIPEGFPSAGEPGESQYERRIIKMVGGDPTEAALVTLLSQVRLRDLYKGKLTDAVETAVVNSYERFGTPRFLVRLSPRLWLVADPDDFHLYSNGNKTMLVNFHNLRNFAYSMSRITEEKVIEVISQTSTLSKEEIEKLVRKYV
jgi:hypothetical protein